MGEQCRRALFRVRGVLVALAEVQPALRVRKPVGELDGQATASGTCFAAMATANGLSLAATASLHAATVTMDTLATLAIAIATGITDAIYSEVVAAAICSIKAAASAVASSVASMACSAWVAAASMARGSLSTGEQYHLLAPTIKALVGTDPGGPVRTWSMLLKGL